MFKYRRSDGKAMQILRLTCMQDASGWTPLMIAASLREGDDLVDLLLSKEAEVNVKSRTSSCHLSTRASDYGSRRCSYD